MHAFTSHSATANAPVGTQSGEVSESPHRLILMLFDGAIEAVTRTRAHLKANRRGERGETASRAIEIVEMGLKTSLDRKSGGELALSLVDLYDHIARLVLAGSAGSKDEKLAEAARLLAELRDAWSRIAPAGDGKAP
jgi:flagellar protein FliS